MFDPSDHDVTDDWGFIPSPVEKPNLRRLPPSYEPWEELLANSIELWKKGDFRKEADKMPLLSTDDLTCESHWRRAYVVLTMLSTTYIWMGTEEDPAKVLPKQLAIPWNEASDKVGARPIITYAAVVLFNFNLIRVTGDPEADLKSENIEIMHTLTGTDDEKWFYMGSLLVEIAAISGLRVFQRAFQAVANKDDQSLSACFDEILSSLQNMTHALLRTKETKGDDPSTFKCDPSFFYQKLRIFFNGTNSKPFEKKNIRLKYEGVEEQPKAYGGASAGQSSVMPAFDEFFGVKYKHPADEKTPDVKEFFAEQRWHMPGQHRKYLKIVSEKSFVRDYVKATDNAELKAKYDSCIDKLLMFRNTHYKLVDTYIMKFMSDASSEGRGTGGTPLKKFLNEVMEQTRKHRFKNSES